jgi:hypothetical protein
VHRADAFTRCPQSEKWAGNGFSLLILLLITEVFPFIRVNGNDTLLAGCIPYPEFVGTDLLLNADDLPHGAAAVTAALAYKGYFCDLPFLPVGIRNG